MARRGLLSTADVLDELELDQGDFDDDEPMMPGSDDDFEDVYLDNLEMRMTTSTLPLPVIYQALAHTPPLPEVNQAQARTPPLPTEHQAHAQTSLPLPMAQPWTHSPAGPRH